MMPSHIIKEPVLLSTKEEQEEAFLIGGTQWILTSQLRKVVDELIPVHSLDEIETGKDWEHSPILITRDNWNQLKQEAGL